MRTNRAWALTLIASLTLGACSASTTTSAGATPATTSSSTSAPASASTATSTASATATSSAAPSPTASSTAAAPSAVAGHHDPVEVTIEDFAFQPAAVEVAPGQTVAWTNMDGEPHTVRSEDGSISSPIVGRTPFEWTAEGAPGTEIPYICSIHPAMKGTVTIAG